jgi:hypothetical protein
MKSYKIGLSTLFLSIAASMSLYAFDLPLGDGEKSLGIKTTHNVDEPFGKPLPWGPTSARFSGNSLWVADTLKNRIVEYEPNGTYKNAITLKMPSYSTIGDFCFGYFGDKKEKALFVCDDDNPIIYVFNSSGNIINQIGSLNTRTILMRPSRIEFYDGKIFVLDIGRSNIFEFNQYLNQGRAIVTYASNFTIENDTLIHIVEYKNKKAIEWYNLKSGKRDYYELDYPKDSEIDFVSINKDMAYIGEVIFEEGASQAQYQIIQVDNKQNLTRLNTNYPVSFMVRSFIKDKAGKLYQIKFDETKPNKLTIDQLPENFKESEG